MYNVELSKKEIQTILMAFKDSEEKLDKVVVNMRCCYSDLPDNFKTFWRDRKLYEKQTDYTANKCFKQIEAINKLEEKIEKIL